MASGTQTREEWLAGLGVGDEVAFSHHNKIIISKIVKAGNVELSVHYSHYSMDIRVTRKTGYSRFGVIQPATNSNLDLMRSKLLDKGRRRIIQNLVSDATDAQLTAIERVLGIEEEGGYAEPITT